MGFGCPPDIKIPGTAKYAGKEFWMHWQQKYEAERLFEKTMFKKNRIFKVGQLKRFGKLLAGKCFPFDILLFYDFTTTDSPQPSGNLLAPDLDQKLQISKKVQRRGLCRAKKRKYK